MLLPRGLILFLRRVSNEVGFASELFLLKLGLSKIIEFFYDSLIESTFLLFVRGDGTPLLSAAVYKSSLAYLR